MTKIRKVKRRKTYKVNINRKRLRNKLRKVPTITCPQIKEAWDSKKSTKSNLKQMGLAYDPNEVLKVPNVKGDLIKSAKRKASGEFLDQPNEPTKKRVPKKIEVAQKLESEAKAPRERMFRLPKAQVQFITYLMDKYGDDFKAMANDKKNYYQLTWKQIRQKVNTFKGIPEQYAEYLVQKGEIVLEDPTPLEETRKKIAEENVKKFCTAKKPKKKTIIGQWIEEDVVNDEDKEDEVEDGFDTSKMLEDEGETQSNKNEGKSKAKPQESEKKLKLFPEDEEEGEKKKELGKRNLSKREKLLEKMESSDSEDLEDDDGDDLEFCDLDDLSEEELSEDDILDDGQFLTDSDEED